jgi:hypothetical protein
MPTIQITDETAGRKAATRTWMLEFLDETISAQEFIRRRIYEEVQDYNTRTSDAYHGLVQPTDVERALNATKPRERHKIDWEAQYAQALAAFERNGFIMLVNDTQIESLQEPVLLREGTTVTFLKLVPLVGG